MRLRSRILLVLLLLLIPALVVIDLTGQRIIARVVEERTLARLRAEAQLVGELVVRDGAISPSADAEADRAGRALGVRVTILAADGRVVGDSSLDGEALAAVENHGSRPEVVEALRAGEGLSVRRSGTVGAELHYLAHRVGGSDRPLGVVRLAVPSTEVRSLQTTAGRAVLWASAGVGLLVAALGWAGARRTSSSIETIELFSRSLARGDVAGGPRIPPEAPAEVQQISRSLTAVAARLQEQVRELEEERNLLRTILAGLREGLLIVDGEEHVVLSNATAESSLKHRGSLAGRGAVEVVRDPEFLELVRGALRQGRGGQGRFPMVDGRVLEIRVVPLEGPGLASRGALALILDVTQMERLEAVRRDFVANVSHELRTPLASIRAFVETLIDELAEEAAAKAAPGARELTESVAELRSPDDPAPRSARAREFLEIVERNALRMEELINDLTDLSLIETGAISMTMEEVQVRKSVEQVCASAAGRAGRAGVTLVNEVGEELRAWGDVRRIDQVLTNLIDNAIKFNRPGGSVTVSAQRDGTSLSIAVRDEGAGIPPEHQENVFHRFYRVPGTAARTGTGLGLAIVKHLMRLHGGSVAVASDGRHGSLFTVTFPGRTPAAEPALHPFAPTLG